MKIKYLSISLLFFIHVVYAETSVLPPRDTHAVAYEILNYLEHDSDVAVRTKIADKTLKAFADSVERVFLYTDKKSSFQKTLDFVFYNIFPGDGIASMMQGLVLLPEEKTPKINAMVEALSKKFNIPKPPIFVALRDDLNHAMASSFSINRSMVVLGKELLRRFDDDALRVVLAHELGHIKNDHVVKGLVPVGVNIILGILAQSSLEGYLDLFFAKKLSRTERAISFLAIQILLFLPFANLNLHFEQEADDDALKITQDPESFISVMEKFKSYHNEKIKEANEEIKEAEDIRKHLHERLDLLAQSSPWIASYYKKLIDSYVNQKTKHLNDSIFHDGGTHPSLESRIKVARQMISLKNLRQPVENVPA